MALDIIALQVSGSGIILMIAVISLFFLILTYKRFLKGDFKKIMRSLVIIVLFLVLHKFFDLLQIKYKSQYIELLSVGAFFMSVLFIFYLAFQLYNFSKVFGFADIKENNTFPIKKINKRKK